MREEGGPGTPCQGAVSLTLRQRHSWGRSCHSSQAPPWPPPVSLYLGPQGPLSLTRFWKGRRLPGLFSRGGGRGLSGPDSSFRTSPPSPGAQGLRPGLGTGGPWLLCCPGLLRSSAEGWGQVEHWARRAPQHPSVWGSEHGPFGLVGGGPAVWLRWASEGTHFLSIGTMSASLSGFKQELGAGVSCPQSLAPFLGSSWSAGTLAMGNAGRWGGWRVRMWSGGWPRVATL